MCLCLCVCMCVYVCVCVCVCVRVCVVWSGGGGRLYSGLPINRREETFNAGARSV